MGLFVVDDAQGRIGSILPGQPGYIEEALSDSRRDIIFARSGTNGAANTIELPAQSYVGFYLIQNATTERFLNHNPRNELNQEPLAFFFFPQGNPDGIDHLQDMAATESDTGELGDGTTTERIVNLVGQTEPGLEMVLVETQQMVTADSDGNFTFTDVPMPIAGTAPFSLATVDIAGNLGRVQKQFTRIGINGAPEIISTPETVFDTDEQDNYTYQIEAVDPDNDTLTYSLLNGLQGVEMDERGLLTFKPEGNLRPSYDFNIEVSDGRGGTDT